MNTKEILLKLADKINDFQEKISNSEYSSLSDRLEHISKNISQQKIYKIPLEIPIYPLPINKNPIPMTNRKHCKFIYKKNLTVNLDNGVLHSYKKSDKCIMNCIGGKKYCSRHSKK